MPTPSEQTRGAACGDRNDAPHRSVFGNYKLAETEGPGAENAALPLSPGEKEQRPQRVEEPEAPRNFAAPDEIQPVRSAAVLGSSNVVTANTPELCQASPAPNPAAPEDGRTPLNMCQGEGRGGEGAERDPEWLQTSLDTAVARSFLYRFIAKAFEDPERDGWQSLCQAELQAAFGSAVRALAEGAPPNLESAAGKLFGHLKPDGYTAFESDYVTCFGHTVRGDCPMNEIEYGDIKADPLFQPHRLADLGAFYAAFGLEIGHDAAERQDHISIELEFMSVLAAKEAYAIEHNFDDEQTTLVRDAQKKFLREHLGRWTPAFTRRLSRIAGDGSLGALANFTCEFITADCVRFNVTPGSEDLLLRPIDDSLETLCASCGISSLPPGAITAPVAT